jgi:hypothetical protein
MEKMKIPLWHIYEMYELDIRNIAQQAGVDHTVVSRLFMGVGSASKGDAEKILATLTRQTGRNYTLETVEIACTITNP